MKKALIILVALLLLLTIPIYAAGRIVVPTWVKTQIAENLPKGAQLTIGEVKSNLDLSFVFEEISFDYLNTTLLFSEIEFKPRLSLKEPLILTSSDIKLVNVENTVQLNGVVVKIIPSDLYMSDLNLKGSVTTLDSTEVMLLSNTDFIISEIKNKKISLSIASEMAKFNFSVPLGNVLFQLEDLIANIDFSPDPKVSIKAERAVYDLTALGIEDADRKIFSRDIDTTVKVEKRKVLEVPIKYSSGVMTSPLGRVADKIDLRATGGWNQLSEKCETTNIFQILNGKCGQLIDMTGIHLSATDRVGRFVFSAEGRCVARGSGCPQMIVGEIKSLNTADIFSNLMKSNIVNPLITGVLMGALLGSPVTNDPGFDHIANFKVNGAQIFLNNKPLFN